MSWRIVYVESETTLQLFLDNLKVINHDDELLIPLSDIHTVILDNYKILLSVQLINQFSHNNINVVICDLAHLPKTLIMPINGHSLSPLILKNQIAWDEDIKKEVHQKIVTNKIRNQAAVLRHFNCNTDVIAAVLKFSEEVSVGDATNREGLASKMYFRELFGKDFIRFNEDILNAGLNYGYAILRSLISKSVVAKGLHPSIGVFHIGRNNPYNLSDDIIEVYRPIIDVWVKNNLMDEKIFIKEHRLELIKQTLTSVVISNKKQTLFNGINIFVDNLIRIFSSSIDEYEETELIL